jgi:hypothetical protein
MQLQHANPVVVARGGAGARRGEHRLVDSSQAAGMSVMCDIVSLPAAAAQQLLAAGKILTADRPAAPRRPAI